MLSTVFILLHYLYRADYFSIREISSVKHLKVQRAVYLGQAPCSRDGVTLLYPSGTTMPALSSRCSVQWLLDLPVIQTVVASNAFNHSALIGIVIATMRPTIDFQIRQNYYSYVMTKY